MTKKKSEMSEEEFLRVKAQGDALREKHRDSINAKQRARRAVEKASRDAVPVLTSDERMAEKKKRASDRKRAWAKKNADHVKAKRKEKYALTRDESIAKAVKWNRKNKDQRKAICAKYSIKNPEQRRATKAKRRARKNMVGGSFSKNDVKSLLIQQKSQCAICRDKLPTSYEVDHIVPLALGGGNDKFNLQILCMTCNRSKGAKDPIDFMQQRGFLL